MKRLALLAPPRRRLQAGNGRHRHDAGRTRASRSAIRYVGAPELAVREQPNDTAPVIATYQNGEAVSVLADKGEWVEVRTGDRAGLGAQRPISPTAEGKQEAEDNPQPKFRVMPMPVSAPSARGEIYHRSRRELRRRSHRRPHALNTTGSTALEAQNTAGAEERRGSTRSCRTNERVKFKYYHRVTY